MPLGLSAWAQDGGGSGTDAAMAGPVVRGTVQRGASGYPIPRFVALDTSKANLRVGPDSRYPVRWQYRRRGLPLLVVGEYDVWREVRDPDGETGWMHVALLTGARTVMVTGRRQTLRRLAAADSAALLHADPGVIGSLLGCEAAWCRVRIAEREGWLPRAGLWGVFADPADTGG